MTAITETDVVQACKTLFGTEIDISRHFLYYSVQPSGVKSAYRKKAKETHPDLFAAHALHVQQKQTELFREILRAYDVLTLFFKQREEGCWRPGTKPSRPVYQQKAQHQTRTASRPSANRTAEDKYYQGHVPRRTLQIGRYLYYRGKISFQTYISALLWQRKQRPSIGDIALRWRMLDSEGVDKIFNLCIPRPFGEKAVELGLLTIFQVNTILLYQRTLQERLGTYFVQNRMLTREQLERLVLDLNEHNTKILAESLKKKFEQRVYA